MTIKELKEQKEKDRQYREKALNYLVNEKGFVLVSDDKIRTLLRKGSFDAFVYNNKTSFQNHKTWSLTRINHEDIENYDFIENEIVRIGEEKPTMILKELRKRAGMTRQELAEKSGVSYNSIKSYEYGARDIQDASYRNLKRLADVFGVSVEEIAENSSKSL